MPKDAQILLERARGLAAAGNYEAALPLLDEVAALSASFVARAYRSKAIIFGRMKDYRQSVEWWEESLKVNPHHADGWYQMGMCYFRLAEFGTALGCYQRARQLGLQRPGLQQNIEACERNLDAERDYANEWQAHSEDGVALFHSGRMAEAQSESALALHLARKHGNQIGEASSLAQLGRCKVARGQLAEGFSDLRKAEQVASQPTNDQARARLLEVLGICYRDIGLLSRAIRFLEDALKAGSSADPSSLALACDVSANLGRTYMYRNWVDRHDVDRAETILLDAARQAVGITARNIDEIRPKARVWEALGALYTQTSDLGKAVDCLTFSRSCRQERASVPEPDLTRLGQTRCTAADLLPIIDLLDQELGAAESGEYVQSRIARQFLTAKAHIELASRVPRRRSSRILRFLGLADKSLAHLKKAHDLLATGIGTLEREFEHGLRRAGFALTFAEHRFDAYEDMVRTCLTLGKLTTAFEYVERSKSHALASEVARTATRTLAGGARPVAFQKELLDELRKHAGGVNGDDKEAPAKRAMPYDTQGWRKKRSSRFRNGASEENSLWEAAASFGEVRACLRNA